MAKIRTKCCPFCGCDQVTIRCDHVFNVYYSIVVCDQCGASGPSVTDSKLMDGFIEAAPEEEIVAVMKELAANNWNCRPPMSDVFPEDIAAFEQFGETVGADIRSEHDG